MAKTYTVKIVDEQEWQKIVESDPRYAEVNEENLGFSDPQKGKAYVREEVVKIWPGAKQYLMEHEFSHLVSDEPWHEDEHGVRHKKFFKQTLPAIGFGGALPIIQRAGKSFKKATTTPQVPNLSQLPSVKGFQQLSQQQYSPLLSRLQNLSNTPLPENLASPIYRQYQGAQRDLYNQFAAAQPGTDLSSSTGPTGYRSAYEDLLQRQAESLANAQFGYQGNERNNILGQFGVTQQALNDQFLTPQLDIDTIMANTGLKAEQVKQFQQLLGSVGQGVGNAAGFAMFHP